MRKTNKTPHRSSFPLRDEAPSQDDALRKAEQRAESPDAGQKPMLQWHPAFYAGIQIEFAEEAEELIFENEHQLGTKPKEIDVLIIKKKPECRLHKNIGRIFRTYNIIEYKSPEDYLGIDDYYKVLGYACFYKADSPRVDGIKAGEITVTFVCSHYPRKLARHLERDRSFTITRQESGIYYIAGDTFPAQLIVTSELSKGSNFWLYSLTNRIQEKKIVEELITEYEKHKGEKLYQSVMDIIIRANSGKAKEVNDMCEAMYEILKDRIDAEKEQVRKDSIQIGMQAGIQTGIQTGIQQGIKALIEACKSLGASWEAIKNVLLEKFSVTEGEAEEYMQLYW